LQLLDAIRLQRLAAARRCWPAARLASELGVRTADTHGINKSWADTGVDPAKFSAALLAIEARARFLPCASHPLSGGWMSSAQRS